MSNSPKQPASQHPSPAVAVVSEEPHPRRSPMSVILRELQKLHGVPRPRVTRTFKCGVRGLSAEMRGRLEEYFAAYDYTRKVVFDAFRSVSDDGKDVRRLAEALKNAREQKGGSSLLALAKVTESVRQKFPWVSSQAVTTSFAGDCLGALRSFVTNHQKRLEEINGSVFERVRVATRRRRREAEEETTRRGVGGENRERHQENRSLLESLKREHPEWLPQESDRWDPSEFDVESWPASVERQEQVNRINETICEYNQAVNLHNQHADRRAGELSPLRRLPRIPRFPLAGAAGQSGTPGDLTRLPLVGRVRELEKLLGSPPAAYLGRFSNPEWERVVATLRRKRRFRRLARLVEHSAGSDHGPRARFLRLLDFLARETERLKRHLRERHPADRNAFQKLLETLNLRLLLAKLDPLRVDPARLQELRGAVQSAYADIRASLLQQPTRRSRFAIGGFGVGDGGKVQYGGLLAYRTDDDRRKYALIADLSARASSPGFRLGEKIQGEESDGGWVAFAQTGGSRKKALRKPKTVTKRRVEVKAPEDAPRLLVLPLAFTRSQGRKYLYGHRGDSLEEGKLTLSAAKVTAERTEDGKLGNVFVHLAFEKQAADEDYRRFPLDCEHFIGIDRGEVLPAALAVVRKDGTLVETIRLGANLQRAIRDDDESRREAQEAGQRLPQRFRHRVANRKKTVLEQMIADVLDAARRYCGLIVLERLSAGFGREPSIIPLRAYEQFQMALLRALEWVGLARSDERARKFRENGLVAQVTAAHTSQTCRNCGSVFDKERRDDLLERALPHLERRPGDWQLPIPDGQRLLLHKIPWRFYNRRAQRREDTSVGARLEEIERKIGVSTPTETRRALEKQRRRLLEHAVNPRREQEMFSCLLCGSTAYADEQAAHNIALRYMARQEVTGRLGPVEWERFSRRFARDRRLAAEFEANPELARVHSELAEARLRRFC